MISYFGDFAEDDTVYIPFNTFSSDDPSASVTITNLADADIKVHKDGSATQIVTDGATVAIDFDSITGNHLITVDTSVHADYTTGSDYQVRIEGTTVDGATINAWVGSFSIERAGGALALIKAGNLSANVVQISGDSTAADNLELQYDGTGYTDETAPASREQVSSIGTGSGSALNFAVSADNTGGAIIDSVTFVRTQTGTFSNTENNLATFHQIDDASDAFDLVYRIDCGDTRTAISVQVDCYLNGGNDSANIQVYDHVGVGWDTVAEIDGKNGSIVEVFDINLFEKHTGALGTSEAGNLYVRFVTSAQSNPALYIARVTASAVPATSTMGYEGGQVWIDEDNGKSTGTTLGIDGTFANQCLDFDDGQTIADSLGTSFLHTHPGNSITLTSALQGYNVSNVQCTLNGGSQNADSTRINGGFVAGTWTRAGTGIMTFVGCSLTNLTSDRCAILQSSGIVGTLTLTEAGLYPIVDAQAGGPTGIATIDFASLGGATVNLEGWKGNLTITNMASGDTLNVHAAAGGDLILGGADGTVYVSGNFGSVTDNRTGSPTLTDLSSAARFTGIEGATFSTSTDSLDALAVSLANVQKATVQKNQAYSDFEFPMKLTSDHYTAATGATVTGERSLEGGAFESVSGTIAEIGDGIYQFDAAAADTNADSVTWKFSATDCDDTVIHIKTST